MSKSNNRKITIPEPCHEDWSNMTPEQKGRHCEQCNKVVVDFTKSSQEEILDHLDNSEGRTCGRFKKDQIFKPNVTKNMTKIAASIMAIAAANGTLNAQEEEFLIGDYVGVDPFHETVADSAVNPVIKGSVSNGNLKEISGAKISIFSGGSLLKTALTAPDGSFMMVLDGERMVQNTIDITVHAKNYQTKNLYHLILQKADTNLRIVMSSTIEEFTPVMMGKAICVLPEPTEQNYVKGDVAVSEPEIHVTGEIFAEPVDTTEIEEIKGNAIVEPDTNQNIWGQVIAEPDSSELVEPTIDTVGIDVEMGDTIIWEEMGEIEIYEGPLEPINPEPVDPPSVDTTTIQASPINENDPSTMMQKGPIILIESLPFDTTSTHGTTPLDTGNGNDQSLNPSESAIEPGVIEIEAYPNPSSDIVYLKISEAGEYKYKVTDMLGKIVKEGFFTGSKMEFTFRNQRPGVYLINLYEGSELKKTTKVVIQ